MGRYVLDAFASEMHATPVTDAFEIFLAAHQHLVFSANGVLTVTVWRARRGVGDIVAKAGTRQYAAHWMVLRFDGGGNAATPALGGGTPLVQSVDRSIRDVLGRPLIAC